MCRSENISIEPSCGSDSEVFTDIEIINNNFGIRIDGRLKRGSV